MEVKSQVCLTELIETTSSGSGQQDQTLQAGCSWAVGAYKPFIHLCDTSTWASLVRPDQGEMVKQMKGRTLASSPGRTKKRPLKQPGGWINRWSRPGPKVLLVPGSSEWGGWGHSETVGTVKWSQWPLIKEKMSFLRRCWNYWNCLEMALLFLDGWASKVKAPDWYIYCLLKLLTFYNE